jgi:hypothetical protein
MTQNKIEPVLTESFYGVGRGPELVKVHWAYFGNTLRAIDFLSPDNDQPKHLFFTGVQVFMFTPEEVINYSTLHFAWDTYRGAKIICLGKSPWLNSFSPQHLEKCLHYELMFYDDLLDVICEKIELREGQYLAGSL